MSMNNPNSAAGEDYNLHDHEYSFMSSMYDDGEVGMNEVETKENEIVEEGMTMDGFSNEANTSTITGDASYQQTTMPEGAMADYNSFLDSMGEENKEAPPAEGDYGGGGLNENDQNVTNEAEDNVDEDIPPPDYSISIEDTTHLAETFVETMKSWSDKLVQAMTTHDKATTEYHKEYTRIQRLEQAEAQRLQNLEADVNGATYGFPNISSLMGGGGGNGDM